MGISLVLLELEFMAHILDVAMAMDMASWVSAPLYLLD